MRRIPFLFVLYAGSAWGSRTPRTLSTTSNGQEQLLSAILAVALWPLVLVGFDVKVT
jgi:hypothetical protein